MTPAEALQHVIEMSTDGTEAVSDLKILGFAVVPIEPTGAMRMAGSMTMNAHRLLKSRHRAGAPDIYAAMVAEATRSCRVLTTDGRIKPG